MQINTLFSICACWEVFALFSRVNERTFSFGGLTVWIVPTSYLLSRHFFSRSTDLFLQIYNFVFSSHLESLLPVLALRVGGQIGGDHRICLLKFFLHENLFLLFGFMFVFNYGLQVHIHIALVSGLLEIPLFVYRVLWSFAYPVKNVTFAHGLLFLWIPLEMDYLFLLLLLFSFVHVIALRFAELYSNFLNHVFGKGLSLFFGWSFRSSKGVLQLIDELV